jgi:UDP-N-acetylmuramoyl-tripeptide--D-alanyl-D-alanine ligase
VRAHGIQRINALALGDMGEVGNDAPERHAEIGAYAQSKGIDALYAVGTHMVQACRAFNTGLHFTSQEELVAALRAKLPADAVVLVKGSRFMQMERVVKALQETI